MTLADLLCHQAQHRAQIGWADQCHYPGVPEFQQCEQNPRVDPDGTAVLHDRLHGSNEHALAGPERMQPELSINYVPLPKPKHGQCGDPLQL